VGFVVDKAALGQVFSEYFGVPCHSSSSIIRGRQDRPTYRVQQVDSSLIPTQEAEETELGVAHDSHSKQLRLYKRDAHCESVCSLWTDKAASHCYWG
jgi:hypothetical protein